MPFRCLLMQRAMNLITASKRPTAQRLYMKEAAREACADAAAAVSIGRSAMECVKLQRYHYSTLISGEVNSRAMRREPELAIADCTERYDELYKKLQNKLK